LKHIHSHLDIKANLYLLIRKYRRFGTVADLPRPPPPKKLTLLHLQVIDEDLAQDDEISTPELCALLHEVEGGERVSISTLQRAKKDLGKTDFAWCRISL